MDYKIIIQEIAEKEYNLAVDYYLEINSKLAKQFQDEIYSGFEAISINPYGYQTIYKNIRHFVLKTFPYKILYTIIEDKKQIIIISFFHTSRNLKNWKKRVEK